MSFNILYVENRYRDWIKLKTAVDQWTQSSDGEPLFIDRATNPEELNNKLNLKFDLILADVYFPDSSPGGESNKLREIIESVKNWSARQPTGRPLPIIAYTGRGKDTLDECLEYKDDLFDIWEKSSASPEYAAWRFSLLSKEINRLRPDALIQRRIREMKSGASWHSHVVEMTKRYDEGRTEMDQIERVAGPIGSIALELGERVTCKRLWKAMVDWESLSRAVSRKTRGHARHVINVFWLGYYLLHNEYLRPIFISGWQKILDRRSNSGDVKGEDPTESLSNAWFYAGLFHDVGGIIEKASEVHEFESKLIGLFGENSPSISFKAIGEEYFMKKAEDWLHDFAKPLRELVEKEVRDSVRRMKPDQGAVAAIYLRDNIEGVKQLFYVKEGVRATSLHNIFPSLTLTQKDKLITWEEEPLVCLLLLCDQLQTWDRQRGDDTLKDDHPSRAELSSLDIKLNSDGHPEVNMTIDYIAPSHLSHSPDIYKRVKYELDEILGDHPHQALDKIAKPWPFSLRANCTLSGDPLDTKFSF